MTTNFTRREFLKLASLASLTTAFPHIRLIPDSSLQTTGAKNILIFVFDALSARHISMHGYQRQTTPNLEKLAQRATVYHNHFAGGNFTFPGTASLLTGTYPWTHRGFSPHVGVDPSFETRNLFSTFPAHYRLAYTHNLVAYNLLTQLSGTIDRLKPRQELYLDRDLVALFQNDEDIASISWWQSFVKKSGKSTYSLFLSHIYNLLKDNRIEEFSDLFPRGIPNIRDDNYFILETAIDWTIEQIDSMPAPTLGYFHYLPPHDPYLTRRDFIDVFEGDGYQPPKKPKHLFSTGISDKKAREERQWYDEFILYADAEFGRLFSHLEDSGVLENSWVIFTSDHGEMFERGILKHYHETLHLPVIQVPLLIFEPGQTTRRDVFSNTSAVDLLPTLAHLNGQPLPAWSDGRVLPPYQSPEEVEDRSVFALEAKKSEARGPITPLTGMIVKGTHKLTYYTGYDKLKGDPPLIELYDIQQDPEELTDLTQSEPTLSANLLEELLSEIEKANQPYNG